MAISQLGTEEFENPKVQDAILKAKKGARVATETQFHIMSGLIYQCFTLTGYVGYVFLISRKLLGLILLVCIAVLVSYFIKGKYYGELQNVSVPFKRRRDYFARCLYGREFIKDTRLLNLTDFFYKKFCYADSELNKLENKIARKVFIIDLCLSVVSILCMGGSIILVFYQFYTKSISLGELSSLLVAIDDLFFYFYGTCVIIGNGVKSLPIVLNYFEFIDKMKKTDKDEKDDLGSFHKISIQDVSYSYPLQNKRALSNISFTINKGDKIAIVGRNGSGKTTLALLLCGILTPAEGKILYDGMSMEMFTRESIYRRKSAVFQDFGRYCISIKENITLSDCDRENKEERLQEILNKFSFKEFGLTDNLDAEVGKEFGGLEFSGGQWQRLAILRGFFRIHDMLVMDEPTSSLDPLTEDEVLEKIFDMTEGKTLIMITHKLSSVKNANKIIVLEDGKISQIGDHEYLLKQDGLYKRMFASQAELYERDNMSCMI